MATSEGIVESDNATIAQDESVSSVEPQAVQDLMTEIDRLMSELRTKQSMLDNALLELERAGRSHKEFLPVGAQATADLAGFDVRIRMIKETEDELDRAYATINALQSRLNEILSSTTWRVLGPIRWGAGKLPVGLKRLIRRLLRLIYRGARYMLSGRTTAPRVLVKPLEDSREPYDRWVQDFDTLSDVDRVSIQKHVARLDYLPLISVVMPVYETPEWVLREAIDSVRNQLYPHWELCIADDASPSPHVGLVLREFAKLDPRIKWMQRQKNGHISAASNSALALASGEFVALMDHDDLLPQHALYEVAVALNKDAKFDIIYSDEDQIDANGRRCMPYFKTDWNIDLLLAHNMVSHFGVYRRSLLERVGGFRERFEGSQDYDVTLRCVDATSPDRICHLPAVLYHWRREYGVASFSESKLAQCSAAALRAISDHLARQNELGSVAPHPILPQWSRVTRPVPDPAPLVSVIIPTRDRADLLKRCVEGLLRRTNYPAMEILIVDHESELPETAEFLESVKVDPRVRVLSYIGRFNYSAINNIAAAEANGSILALLNNDVDVINADWLSEMVSLAVCAGVGAVGAKLIYPDERVQHGGIVLGVGGVANHFNHLVHRTDVGYFGRNVLTSTVSAVTGACLVVRKSVFEEVGGLNSADLAVAFNDVDFCLKVREAGYRNIWTPHAELYHFESASRGAEDTPEKAARFKREVDYMLKTWGVWLERDPFYNQNFATDVNACFQLAFPPRRKKPWL